MPDWIDSFLEQNSIDKNDFEAAIRQDILEFCLKKITAYMDESDSNFFEIKSLFLRNKSIKATNMVVSRVCHCSFLSEDYKWLNKCLVAFFKKTNRKALNIEKKEDILKKQSYKCAICNKQINLENAEIDHIIPFDIVGDELDDNYQALCSNCNRRKSDTLSISLENLIYKKK